MRALALPALMVLAQQSYANCTPDLQGVQSSNVSDISSFVSCDGCRSVQDFPQDFRAAASNFVFHDEAGLSALGTSAGTLGNGALIFPICSEDHGQCMTASVSIRMNFVEIPFLGEFRAIPLGVRNHTVRVTDAAGNISEITSLSADPPYSADAPPVYTVPGDTAPDTIADGECQTNTGQNRPSGNDSNGSNGSSGSGGGGGGPAVGGGVGPWHGGGGAPDCRSEDRGDEVVVICSRR